MLGRQPSGSRIEPKLLHRNRQSCGARILVVEDDPSLMRALRSKLSRRHYTVEVVSSGPRALAAFERFRPDLVLFDVDESRPTDWRSSATSGHSNVIVVDGMVRT